VAGERFADFKSDTSLSAASHSAEDGFSLASLSSSLAGGAGLSTPSRSRPQSLARSAPSPNAHSPMAGRAAEASSPQGYEPWERAGPSRTGTSLSVCAGAYYRNSQRASGADRAAAVPSGSSKGGSAPASPVPAARGLAPLVLTWRGSEPLDKLHMAIRVRYNFRTSCAHLLVVLWNGCCSAVQGSPFVF
jgi:hypothetical protein